MHKNPSQNEPWSLYWRANRLQSCIDPHAEERDVLGELWSEFARKLAPGSRCLDLATGNGVVPAHLRRANNALLNVAVDLADIDPARFVEGCAELQSVEFRGGIDLASETNLGTFDAVTSQYGVEYLGIDAAARAVARHLAPGGFCRLVLHARASVVVQEQRGDCEELERLLEVGPAAAMRATAAGEMAAQDLESATHQWVRRGQGTRRLSGAVVQAVDRFLALLESGQPQTAADLAGELLSRLDAELARLRQLEAAALDAGGIQRLSTELAATGVACDEPQAILAGQRRDGTQPLIGWLLDGHRSVR